MLAHLEELKKNIEGDLYFDLTMRTLYATDASVYRELPLAVARPKHVDRALLRPRTPAGDAGAPRRAVRPTLACREFHRAHRSQDRIHSAPQPEPDRRPAWRSSFSGGAGSVEQRLQARARHGGKGRVQLHG